MHDLWEPGVRKLQRLSLFLVRPRMRCLVSKTCSPIATRYQKAQSSSPTPSRAAFTPASRVVAGFGNPADLNFVISACVKLW